VVVTALEKCAVCFRCHPQGALDLLLFVLVFRVDFRFHRHKKSIFRRPSSILVNQKKVEMSKAPSFLVLARFQG